MLGTRGSHDIPLRELEHTSYTFDMVMDQGAYCEFKRHRMTTQSVQELGTSLGYVVPRRISTGGFEDEYRSVMKQAEHFISDLLEKILSCKLCGAKIAIKGGYYLHELARSISFLQLTLCPQCAFFGPANCLTDGGRDCKLAILF